MSADPSHTMIPEDLDPNDTIRVEGEAPAGFVSPGSQSAQQLDTALSLGRVLGTGGMAVVREAEQRVLQRAVAVKSARGGREGSAAQLVLEARITGALEHPGILPIHDIVTDRDGIPHIVMQRVDGTPWSDVMDDPAQLEASFGVSDPLGWNLGVLEAVCNAVHFAHSQGVVHRDLKPENVMVGGFGQVYVVDWGVAVSVRDGDSRFPAAATQRRIVGTPRYMAPEMALGDGRLVSARTDVYLLGAVLFRILEGRPPHRGLGVREILDAIPGFAPSFAPGSPTELCELVTDAMHAEPDARLESAEAFRRRIRAFLEHRGSARLAQQALDRLHQLEALLGSADADRVRAYDLFGAIRFGLLEAIEAWPANEAARDGLDRTLLLMAGWELDQGDDRAAEVLLAALAEVPEALRAQMESVREQRASERGLLERIARQRDPRRGAAQRLAVIVGFGVLWATTPMLTAAWSQGVQVGVSTFWTLLVAAAIYLGRRTWLSSAINRRTALLLLAGVIGDLLLTVGVVLGSLDYRSNLAATQVMIALLLFVGATMVDLRWLFASLAFVVSFLLFTPLEPYRLYVVGVDYLIIAASAAWIWWPRAPEQPRGR
ncbi:MAG: serine/threonine-protein kinase [Myxococcota bacterium]